MTNIQELFEEHREAMQGDIKRLDFHLAHLERRQFIASETFGKLDKTIRGIAIVQYEHALDAMVKSTRTRLKELRLKS